MKRLALIGLLLLLAVDASAAVIKTVQAGATDQSVTLKIIDLADGSPETGVAFNTSGIDLKYWRHGANSVTSITEATQTVSGAHSDGGFVHLGDGLYRLDLPDAAVASGATAVEVFGTVTGMIVIGGTVQLSTDTPQTGDSFARLGAPAGASVSADLAAVEAQTDDIGVAGAGLTNIDLPNQTMDITGTITTATSVTNTVNANTIQVSGDSGAADALEAALDGTAQGARLFGIERVFTAASATSTTLVMDSGAAIADGAAIGMTVVACGSTQGYCQSRGVTDNTLSDDTLTVDAWTVTPSGTITAYLFMTAPGSASGATDVNVVTIEGSDATTVLGTAQTGDAYARLGAPAGASVSADIAAIEAQTDDIGVAGAGLTATDDAVMTRLGAPVGASLSADLAAVKSDTGAILTDTGTTLDALIQAIKAKTDQLTFGITNTLNVNVEYQTGVEICGTGTDGDPWGACP